MFKKLDIWIIRSFIGPFIITFFVTLFVLVMQFFWVYMDELIGKGLGLWMILQLLVLMSTTLVPLALPLAILLAAIMTFGNMGENYELVAIKSAGISLNRFMRPLTLFIAGISVLAFVFNNHIVPVANLKAFSLLYDLRNSKPALNIRAGIFNNDIQGYSIRIGEKGSDGKTIKDIVIYDKTDGFSNTKLILAKEGMMIPVPDEQVLIFRLRDGWRYEESSPQGDRSGRPQTRMHFGQWDKVFDLSSFRVNRTDEDLFKGANQMMNLSQLGTALDSMENLKSGFRSRVHDYIKPYMALLSDRDSAREAPQGQEIAAAPVLRQYDSSFLELVPDDRKSRLLELTASNCRNIKELMRISELDHRIQTENLYKYRIEWHKKFTFSFACLLLFLAGAPLGAIIRKGGMGMPIVVAIAFFLIWYIISITGEKLSRSGAAPAWIGMWIAPAMLLPLALVLVRQARNDSKIFNRDWYLTAWNRIKGLFTSSTSKK